MKNLLLSICVMLFFVVSCKDEKIPKNILPQKKMVKILVDIHIAEAKATHFKFNHPDSSSMMYKIFEKEIFKKYKVSKKSYKKSYDYYSNHPELFDEIYSMVVDSLSHRQKLLKL